MKLTSFNVKSLIPFSLVSSTGEYIQRQHPFSNEMSINRNVIHWLLSQWITFLFSKKSIYHHLYSRSFDGFTAFLSFGSGLVWRCVMESRSYSPELISLFFRHTHSISSKEEEENDNNYDNVNDNDNDNDSLSWGNTLLLCVFPKQIFEDMSLFCRK